MGLMQSDISVVQTAKSNDEMIPTIGVYIIDKYRGSIQVYLPSDIGLAINH